MKYQFASNRGRSCGLECNPTELQIPIAPPEIPGRKNCSINAYGGVFNTSNTALVLIAGAQTVIPTMGYSPNLNTTYSGNGIKIDIEGDYEVSVIVTGADLATSLTVFVRRNGIPIPETTQTNVLQANVSTSFTTSVIVHLNCGDILDIGVTSGIAGTMIINQYGASLTVKKLDTQICCECLEKYRDKGCCSQCPKASHNINTCKNTC